MKDEELMEKILKENEIDIVISAVGGQNILDQLNLVRAIKSVGTIKVKKKHTHTDFNVLMKKVNYYLRNYAIRDTIKTIHYHTNVRFIHYVTLTINNVKGIRGPRRGSAHETH